MPRDEAKLNIRKLLVETALAVLVLFGVIFSVFWFIENRYAKSNEVGLLEFRLKLKIEKDILSNTTNELTELRDQLDSQPDNTIAEKRISKLESEIPSIQANIADYQSRITGLKHD